MSMLSEQVNKLRMLADKLRNVHARQGDDYVESCETLYWSMCAMLDAADTILSLRDRLQDAELGSGTCEWVLEHIGTLYDKWRCSKCGYLFVESRTDQGIKEDFEPNFCPNCGAKVVG